MESIKNRVIEHIRENRMLDDTHTVYVATSGGADSMALLAFMNENQSRLGIDVRAVHINHGIRDITADRDENFVREYCKNHNIHFTAFNVRKDDIYVPENASEEWAREVRYGYFSRLIRNHVKIATAHTLSDQTETVLFRMARGCGLNGMTGIPAVRDEYIRPFLCLTRAEIEALVEHYGTSNITDESNLTDDYSRNKIRHHVVPVLKDINTDAEKNIGKICGRISKAYEYIHKVSEEELQKCCNQHSFWYDVRGFINQDDIIRDEMVSIFLEYHDALNENYINIMNRYLDKVRYSENEEIVGEFQISDTRSILITNQYISVMVKNVESQPLQVGLNNFGQFGHCIYVEEVSYFQFLQRAASDKRNLAFYADADKLNIENLRIVGKSDGDRFKPACKTRNKVTNLMRDRALCERNTIPLVKNQNDEIIYFWNLGFTDGYLPDENSKKIYRFVWCNTKN